MARSGRFSFFLAALAMLSSAPFAFGADDGDGLAGPTLRIPGLPAIPLPPNTRVFGPEGDAAAAGVPDADIYHEYGTVTPGGGRGGGRGAVGGLGGRGGADMYGGTVIGPGGMVKPGGEAPRREAAPKKRPQTPEEKQAQIRKALAPKPPLAVSRRQSLDRLYVKLAGAKDEDEAKGIASLIGAIWQRSGSDTTDLLMARADKAIDGKNYDLAIRLLDRVVDLQPSFAEGWNRRASARYLAGDLNGAMADVDQVLKLEPNHFGALNGLALILQRTGLDKRALQVYRRELGVYPHQPQVEKVVEKLTLDVEGQGI